MPVVGGMLAGCYTGGTPNLNAVGMAFNVESSLFPLLNTADAINSGSQPEVDGLEGYRSQAICMAVYESGYFGRSVTIEEIENLSLEGYQKEINDEIGVE